MIAVKIVDFSPYPAGRDAKDGPFNGAKFRDEVLVPAIKIGLARGEKVTVFLDDVKSYGSSFLEEAFGGLIRVAQFNRSDVIKTLDIRANRPVYFNVKRQIEAFIKQAPTSDK